MLFTWLKWSMCQICRPWWWENVPTTSILSFRGWMWHVSTPWTSALKSGALLWVAFWLTHTYVTHYGGVLSTIVYGTANRFSGYRFKRFSQCLTSICVVAVWIYTYIYYYLVWLRLLQSVNQSTLRSNIQTLCQTHAPLWVPAGWARPEPLLWIDFHNHCSGCWDFLIPSLSQTLLNLLFFTWIHFILIHVY